MYNSKDKELFGKNKYIIIICMVIIFAAVNTVYAATSPHKEEILAADGVMDLGAWDFSVNGSVQLNGQWEFYWKQLLYPSDLSETAPKGRAFVYVPSWWDDYEIAGQRHGGVGYTTYRLVINTVDTDNLLALRIPNICTAHKLWVNGKLASQDGISRRQTDLFTLP
ncbi:MAG: hypothetical protein ACYDEJ_11065 [Desulfitobacteriaceae bacterium]